MKYLIIWLIVVLFSMSLFKVASREDREMEKMWMEESKKKEKNE